MSKILKSVKGVDQRGKRNRMCGLREEKQRQ